MLIILIYQAIYNRMEKHLYLQMVHQVVIKEIQNMLQNIRNMQVVRFLMDWPQDMEMDSMKHKLGLVIGKITMLLVRFSRAELIGMVRRLPACSALTTTMVTAATTSYGFRTVLVVQ